MKRLALLFAIFGALTSPVLAETTWEKLDRGIDVVRECGGDVRLR